MSEECVRTVDIDKENIFVNPFDNVEPIEDSIYMYEKYLSCPANRNILARIGDNEIVSQEYESFGVTRSEILRKLACKYNLRSKLTIVRRDLIMNTAGILVNQVNCEGEMGGDVTTSIKKVYTEIETTYNKLQVKVPGIIQLVKVVDGKHPLWICNLFGQKKPKTPSGYSRTIEFLKKEIFKLSRTVSLKKKEEKLEFLKRGMSKLRVQIKKNHLENLTVYIPYNMGEFQGYNWLEYKPIIQKYLPSSVICIK